MLKKEKNQLRSDILAVQASWEAEVLKIQSQLQSVMAENKKQQTKHISKEKDLASELKDKKEEIKRLTSQLKD